MRVLKLAAGLMLAGVMVAGGCGGDSSNGGTGGSSGSNGGSAGSSSGNGGGAGSSSNGGSAGSSSGNGGGAGSSSNGGAGGGGSVTPAFTSISPCTDVTKYATSPTSIAFSSDTFLYDPACLQIKKGSSVTFNGDFTMHPLAATGMNKSTSPITSTTTGTTATFAFPASGFYSYQCTIHFGIGMKGVIWVTD